MKVDEYEDQDHWVTRLKDRLWGGGGDDDEEEDGFGAMNGPATTGRVNHRRNGSGTLLHVHASRGSQISKRTPTTLADAQRAAEDLKESRPVIVNLEQASEGLALRVMDFISGVTYALNGYYERVGDKVFLFTPANIVIADEDEVEPGGKGLFDEDE
jgi:cell division inhibitor SepF